MGFGIGDALGIASGALGLFGGNDAAQSGADAALQAARPLNVRGQFGSVRFGKRGLKTKLSPRFRRHFADASNLARRSSLELDRFNVRQAENNALRRFRALSQPAQTRRRAAVENREFQRGRLGLGVAQPRTGGFANPELAALAEGEAFEDSLLSQQAVDFARSEQQRLMGNFFNNLQAAQGIANLPIQQAQLGISAANPAGLAGLQAQVGFDNARNIQAFAGGLGGSIGGFFSRGGTQFSQPRFGTPMPGSRGG